MCETDLLQSTIRIKKTDYNYYLISIDIWLRAQIKNKKAGTLGDFSCFSFHAQKNLTTLGEGGAIYVKEKKLIGMQIEGLQSDKNTNDIYNWSNQPFIYTGPFVSP